MTRPRTIFLGVTAMILALAGTTAAYAAPHASRSASAGPTVNLAATSRGCAVVHVALHGSKAPTITCLSRTRPVILARHTGSDAVPDTQQLPNCDAGPIYLDIYEASVSPYQICFTGTGYLGISGITEVTGIYAAYETWVRLYFNDVGSYFNVAPGQSEEFYDSDGGPQTVGITQVDIDNGYHS